VDRAREDWQVLRQYQRRRLTWPTIHSNLVSHRRERLAPRRHRQIRRRVRQRPSLPIPGVSLRRLRSQVGDSRRSPRSSHSQVGDSRRSSPVGGSPLNHHNPAGASRHNPAGASRHSSQVGASRRSPRNSRSQVGARPRSPRNSRSPLSPLSRRSPSSPLGVSRRHSSRPGDSPHSPRSSPVGVNLLSNPAIPPSATGRPAMGRVRQVAGSPCRACPCPRG
jgi:hypothetical protein